MDNDKVLAITFITFVLIIAVGCNYATTIERDTLIKLVEAGATPVEAKCSLKENFSAGDVITCNNALLHK